MMAVSAAASAIVTMLMMVVVVTTSLTVVTAASAALTMNMVDEVLDFLLCGLTILGNHSAEEQSLAGQGVVQVHLHLLLGHFLYAAIEVVAVLILQGYDGSLVDVLVVKMAVDGEDGTLQFEHTRLFVVAVSLVLGQLEREVFTLLKVLDVLLEGIERESEAADEVKRAFGGGLFYKVFTFFIYCVQLILYGNIPIAHNSYCYV